MSSSLSCIVSTTMRASRSSARIRADGLQPVHPRHLQVHQRDVRLDAPECLHGLFPVAGLRHDGDVGVQSDDAADALTDEAVVVRRTTLESRTRSCAHSCATRRRADFDDGALARAARDRAGARAPARHARACPAAPGARPVPPRVTASSTTKPPPLSDTVSLTVSAWKLKTTWMCVARPWRARVRHRLVPDTQQLQFDLARRSGAAGLRPPLPPARAAWP